jgi:hypothetical protein
MKQATVDIKLTVQETEYLWQTQETDCLSCGPYPCWSIAGFIAVASK